MKKLILFLLLSVNCFSQLPYPIQSWANGTPASTCVFQSNVTAGSTIMAISTWQTSTNTPTVSDTRSTSFSQAYIDTSQTVRGAIYVGTAPTSGADTVTFTVSGSSGQNVACVEWNMGSISTTVDVGNVTAFVTSNHVAATNLATNVNGDLLVSFSTNTGGNGWGDETLGDKYLSTCPACGFASGYRITGVAGNYTTTYGLPSGGNQTGSIFQVAFKSSAITIVSPATIPDAIQGNTYSYTMQAVGGAGAYTWSISSGALPLSLSINSSTGAITGTATNSASGAFTVQVTDGSATTTQSTTLHVGTGAATATHVKNSNTSGVFTGGVTAGDLIIVSSAQLSTGLMGILKCTDSIGTVYKLSMNFYGIRAAEQFQVSEGVAPSTAANTVSCAGAGGSTIIATEYSGVQYFDDTQIYTVGTSGTTLTTSSLTTTAVNALLFSTWTTRSNVTSTSYGTCTSTFDHLTSESFGCYQIATTVTGYTESLTVNADATDWGSTFNSFRPASTGTAPLPPSNSGSSQVY